MALRLALLTWASGENEARTNAGWKAFLLKTVVQGALIGAGFFFTKCQAWTGRVSLIILIGIITLCAGPKPVLGNIFVAVPGSGGTVFFPGIIGEYTNSGATVNASLITVSIAPDGVNQIAVSDGFVYVVNRTAGTIGKYTTSGATIDPALISGLDGPVDVEVSGGFIYVAEGGKNRVGKYTNSGATVNASLITGLVVASGLAVSGTDLFVGDRVHNQAAVGHYTTSGDTIDKAFLTGDFLQAGGPNDVEVSGSNLFVDYSSGDDAFLAKYNVNGKLITPDLIGSCGSVIAISGTDIFMTFGDSVSKFTTSGEFVTPLIGPFGGNGITGIAVDGSTVPESLSSLWFGLTVAGLFGLARLLRTRSTIAR